MQINVHLVTSPTLTLPDSASHIHDARSFVVVIAAALPGFIIIIINNNKKVIVVVIAMSSSLVYGSDCVGERDAGRAFL